jgi:hypothetical protein
MLTTNLIEPCECVGIRAEHCAFAVLDEWGKCIACCSKNNSHFDCIGRKHMMIWDKREEENYHG